VRRRANEVQAEVSSLSTESLSEDALAIRNVYLDSIDDSALCNSDLVVLESIFLADKSRGRNEGLKLIFQGDVINSDSAIALSHVVESHQNISSLSLLNCNLSTQVFEQLGRGLRKNTLLSSLDLSYCFMANNQVSRLLKFVDGNHTLRNLSLRSTGLDEACASTIVNKLILTTNHALSSIDLSNNNLNHRSLEFITRACQCRTSLIEVKIEGNDVTPPRLRMSQRTSLGLHREFSDSSGDSEQKEELHLPDITFWNLEQCEEKLEIVTRRNSLILDIVDSILDSVTSYSPQFSPPIISEPTGWFGFTETKGRRPTMEDLVLLKQNFKIPPDFTSHVFGIFDGHGGTQCARFVRSLLLEHLEFELERDVDDSPVVDRLGVCVFDALTAIQLRCRHFNIDHGTCALVTMLVGRDLIVATLGDSQALVVGDNPPIFLSDVVTPKDEEERARIESTGYFVSGNGRLCGCLAVSRALGDIQFVPGVSSEALVKHHAISDADRMLVLACDGVWNKLHAEQVHNLLKFVTCPVRASQLVLKLAYDLGSKDNITVICINLRDYIEENNLVRNFKRISI